MTKRPGKVLTISSTIGLLLGIAFLVIWYISVDTSPIRLGPGDYMEAHIDDEEFAQGVMVGVIWCLLCGIGLLIGIVRYLRK